MKPIEKLCWRVGFAIFGLILLANMHGCGSADKSIGPQQQDEVRPAEPPARAAKAAVKPAYVVCFMEAPSGTEIKFSRSISGLGQSFEYSTVVNDRVARVYLESPGYYLAFAVAPDGQKIGEWNSIPINEGKNLLEFFIPKGFEILRAEESPEAWFKVMLDSTTPSGRRIYADTRSQLVTTLKVASAGSLVLHSLQLRLDGDLPPSLIEKVYLWQGERILATGEFDETRKAKMHIFGELPTISDGLYTLPVTVDLKYPSKEEERLTLTGSTFAVNFDGESAETLDILTGKIRFGGGESTSAPKHEYITGAVKFSSPAAGDVFSAGSAIPIRWPGFYVGAETIIFLWSVEKDITEGVIAPGLNDWNIQPSEFIWDSSWGLITDSPMPQKFQVYLPTKFRIVMVCRTTAAVSISDSFIIRP